MKRQKDIKSAVTIFMAIALALFLPGLSIAGSLELSDPPGPTMKTLDQIPPTWSQILPASERFQGVFGYDDVCYIGGQPYPCTKYYAVLDKETGLVWVKHPWLGDERWDVAQLSCNFMYLGGRYGWRLPTIQELMSLVVNDQPNGWGNVVLPSGHPFEYVESPGVYWSATTRSPDTAWVLNIGGNLASLPKTDSAHYWCVRGGLGVNDH